MSKPDPEFFETVIIGGGQAGLTAGYYLSKQNRPFVILDANERVGDAWRKRWDSLRLFTPACFSSLPGVPFEAPAWSYPTKDELADYLESYAERFELPVRTGITVDRLSKVDGRFVISAGESRFEADNVVVATGAHRIPKVPDFAPELDPRITQLHSSEYRNPAQLQEGDVLVVGRRQFWCRDRGRPLLDTPLLACGREDRRDPRPTRHVSCSARLSRLPVPGPPRSENGHADRPEGGAEAPLEGRSLDPDEGEGPPGCRRRERPEGGGRARRSAGARGRSSSRRVERRVVHRVPDGLQLDRPAGVRRATGSRSMSEASSSPSRACTSSGSSSSTRSRRMCFRIAGETPSTSQSTSEHPTRRRPGRRQAHWPA